MKGGNVSYKRFGLTVEVAFLSIIFLVVPCTFAADYPSRPITLLVGYPAGGSTDIQARFLAKSMEKVLGQPVIVSNQPGVGGAIAAIALKKAKADGYTLTYHADLNFFFQPLYMEHIQKETPPYQADEFDYLAVCARYQGAFCDRPENPWKDWQGMMAEAKKKTREFTFGSMGPIRKFQFEIVCKQEGVNFRIVPYKGGAEVAAAILGGHVDMGFLNGIQIKYLDTGKMRILASAMPVRLKSAPNAPTIEELGYKGVARYDNMLFIGPRGLPEEVKMKLGKAIEIAVKDPLFRDLVEKTLLQEIDYIGSEGIPAYLAKQKQIYESFIKQDMGK